jgi:hypothetical protein
MNNDKAKSVDELDKSLNKVDGSKVLGGRVAKNELSNNTKKSNWIGSCGSIIPQ